MFINWVSWLVIDLVLVNQLGELGPCRLWIDSEIISDESSDLSTVIYISRWKLLAAQPIQFPNKFPFLAREAIQEQ